MKRTYLHQRADARPHVVGLGRVEDVVELVASVVSLKANPYEITDLDVGTLPPNRLPDLQPARRHRGLLCAAQMDRTQPGGGGGLGWGGVGGFGPPG